MSKALFALPILAVALIATKSAPTNEPAPLPVMAPAAIAQDPQNLLQLDLSNGGHVTIQLRPDAAPSHVARIRALVARGFYNGLSFHRVIPGFMAQTGDPTGTGQGGSELPNLTAEFNSLPHVRGAVAAARTDDPNTFNSQFFIVFSPTLSLDRKYTVFGRVIEGMTSVDQIAPGEPPAEPTKIVRATLGAALPAPAVAAPAPAPAPVAPAASPAAAAGQARAPAPAGG